MTSEEETPNADEGRRLSEGLGAWQPIETAPRDETLVIGYDDGAWPMQFNPRAGCWELYYGMTWASGSTKCEPTHWMPMPAAPVSA